MKYVLTCASVWENDKIVDKYPIIKKYNPVIDYPYNDEEDPEEYPRVTIEVDDLVKFCYDIDKDIVIGKAYLDADKGMLRLTIYDDYLE